MQLTAITQPFSSSPLSSAKTAGAPKNPNDPEPRASSVPEPDGTQSADKFSVPGTSQSSKQELTDANHRAIAELRKIDREVRAHEQAHLAAAGGLARGGASFGYTQGPDGRRYAVSGEVSIDTSPGSNPEATLLKAQRIQAAALAPAQPSGADRAIASAASQMAAKARAELLAERLQPEDSQGTSTETKPLEAEPIDDTVRTGTESNSTTHAAPSNTAETLVQLIKQATSAGDTLGNILNTAV